MLTNIRSLDKTTPIVVLFAQYDPGVVSHIMGRYENLEVHVYLDNRPDKSYIPTIRPYLWYQYLLEDPSREQETYFQIDADVIFREMPSIIYSKIKGNKCIASDCSGYIDGKYLSSRRLGLEIVENFAKILSIPPKLIMDTPGGGAQWLISNPTSQLWWHIWQDSDLLWKYMEPLDSDIQKWTAEMWAQLYNLAKFEWDVLISPELDFCRPTDPLTDWERVNILHNAGVTGTVARELFYKGTYTDKTPFGDDFSFVNREKAGIKYVEAIQAVVL